MKREEAKKALEKLFNFYDELHETTDGEYGYEEMKAIDTAIEALQAEYEDYEHATLVDIKEPLKVSVVRCKDCKYWHSNTEFCDTWSSMNIAQRTTSDAFCSYAERREP